MSDYNSIPRSARLLRAYLALRQIQQKDVAASYGCDAAFVSRIVGGRQVVSEKTFEKLRLAVGRVVGKREQAGG